MMAKHKNLIIALIVGLVIAGVLASAYFSGGSSKKSSAGNNESTISSTKQMVFDEYTLANNGVTAEQMNGLEQALKQYLSAQGKSPDLVAFESPKRQPPNPAASTPFSEIEFVVKLDGVDTYVAKLDSYSLSEVRLYLYSLGGQNLVYDSQNINGYSNESQP
jgi:hypothetical protein